MFCKYCNRPAKTLNSNRQHEIRCKSNPGHLDCTGAKDYTIASTPCEFCKKEYCNSIGLSNHRLRCPSNPDRKLETLSDDGRVRLRVAAIRQNKEKWSDPNSRIVHSESMKKAVERNPESYTSSNRGRAKQIIVDGIKFIGQWEVDFYVWAKEAGLSPKRPVESFTYEWNGTRQYFPDFYIESLDMYVEVKGYETERDRAKWLHFPKKLVIIKEKEIKQIRQGCFIGL